jgi:hypothetical protein
MISTGIYHPFNFVNRVEDIDTQCIYRTPYLSCVITGNFTTVRIVNSGTGATAHTATALTWDYKGETLKAFKISFSPVEGSTYYVEIDGAYYSDSVIKYDLCVTEILSSSDCTNSYFDWSNQIFSLQLLFSNARQLQPTFEYKTVQIVTDKNRIEKTQEQYIRQRIQLVAPSGAAQYLESLKNNTYVALNTYSGYKELINIEVEANEQDNGRYSIFVLSFEYKDTPINTDTCCEIINIDDIISPDSPSGGAECAGFTAEIVNTDGTLTVTLTDAPAGTASYKWYRDNVFLSSATTITIEAPGNYRVDVTIGQCRATASYFKDNACAIFQIDITKSGNAINATVSNLPDGETETYSVVLNGVEVSTSVPYTVTETGTYYIYATAGECKKSKAIYVVLEDDDCDFTIDIIEDAGVLTADTDAALPTYLWELETATGRATVGTAETLQIGAKGIYWLTITNGGCSKETYVYKEPLATTGSCVLARTTTTALQPITVYGIDLTNVVNFTSEVLVTLNGVVQTKVSGSPTLANNYGVDSLGRLLFANPLSNALIIITLI